MSSQLREKTNKSGAGSRRLRKRQKQEEDQLPNSMKKYFSGERSITADEGDSGDNSTHVDIDICQELIDDCDGDKVSSRNDKTENIENSKNLRETTNDENIVREMVMVTPLRENIVREMVTPLRGNIVREMVTPLRGNIVREMVTPLRENIVREMVTPLRENIVREIGYSST